MIKKPLTSLIALSVIVNLTACNTTSSLVKDVNSSSIGALLNAVYNAKRNKKTYKTSFPSRTYNNNQDFYRKKIEIAMANNRQRRNLNRARAKQYRIDKNRKLAKMSTAERKAFQNKEATKKLKALIMGGAILSGYGSNKQPPARSPHDNPLLNRGATASPSSALPNPAPAPAIDPFYDVTPGN